MGSAGRSNVLISRKLVHFRGLGLQPQFRVRGGVQARLPYGLISAKEKVGLTLRSRYTELTPRTHPLSLARFHHFWVPLRGMRNCPETPINWAFGIKQRVLIL